MKGGLVGTLDMDTGEVVGTYRLSAGEMIENGSATDEAGGVVHQAIAISGGQRWKVSTRQE